MGTRVLREHVNSTANSKDVFSICPVLLIDRSSQLAYERLRRLAKEEGSTRADDHALFTPGQHHVGATLIFQKPRPLGAHNRDNDVVIFVP